ncbi:MAG: hypothetical protein JOY78_10740 [Pseudonocardia sp.]|nr:hypothetical protein [Pseudonocardia sp.]
MAFDDQFQNPADFYNQLSPDQQAVAAQQFQQEFQQSSDPTAQQYAQMDPNSVSPQQLGEMHQYAQQSDPSILSRVMSHPILDAVLVGLGIHEFHKHEENR